MSGARRARAPDRGNEEGGAGKRLAWMLGAESCIMAYAEGLRRG